MYVQEVSNYRNSLYTFFWDIKTTFKKVVFFAGPSNNQELWPTLIKPRCKREAKGILCVQALSSLSVNPTELHLALAVCQQNENPFISM